MNTTPNLIFKPRDYGYFFVRLFKRYFLIGFTQTVPCLFIRYLIGFPTVQYLQSMQNSQFHLSPDTTTALPMQALQTYVLLKHYLTQTALMCMWQQCHNPDDSEKR